MMVPNFPIGCFRKRHERLVARHLIYTAIQHSVLHNQQFRVSSRKSNTDLVGFLVHDIKKSLGQWKSSFITYTRRPRHPRHGSCQLTVGLPMRIRLARPHSPIGWLIYDRWTTWICPKDIVIGVIPLAVDCLKSLQHRRCVSYSMSNWPSESAAQEGRFGYAYGIEILKTGASLQLMTESHS